jgi:hypothetical protein
MVEKGIKANPESQRIDTCTHYARNLLSVLSPFANVLPNRCRFRGQTDQCWSLWPTAIRSSGGIPEVRDASNWTCENQAQEEISHLRLFLDAYNLQALWTRHRDTGIEPQVNYGLPNKPLL